jgi:hypothetical protein
MGVNLFKTPPTTVTLTGVSWTVPCGVTSIIVDAWGGGGGGKGDGVVGSNAGGGGGSGAYVLRTIAVTPGTVFTISIGAGGLAGNNGGNGANGGASTLVNGGLGINISAGGGGGATSATGGSAGIAAGGTTNTNGTAGSNSTSAVGGNGAAAPAGGGTGGTGATLGNNGLDGGAPGGGGGGAGDRSGGATDGGNGGAGIIQVTYVGGADARANQNLACGTTVGTLAGSAAINGSTGTWSIIAGAGSITSPNSNTSALTGLSGCTTFRWTISGAGCPSTTDDVVVCAPTVCNDLICTAATLTVGAGCVTGSNIASTGTGETTPSCYNGAPNVLEAVWYTFVATDDSITVNFGDGTLGSQVFGAVYSSSNGTCSGVLTEIECAMSGTEAEATGLVVGNTYFILVDGKADDEGTFCISIYETPPPPPPIGTCSNPRDLYIATDCNNVQGLQYDEQNNMISTNTATGTDAGSSMSGASYLNSVEQGCAGTDNGQQGYWVRFTATSTSVNVANYGGSGYDYSVFSGTPSNATCTAGLTAVNCVVAPALDVTNSIGGLTTGTTYYMLITPSGTGTATTAYACLTGTAYTPPNDNCANATTLSFGTGYTINNSNASVDNNNTLCAGSTENNVWVRYTATYTGTAYVFMQDQDCACGNGMQMSIYNASAGCPNNSTTCSIYINPNNDNDFSGSFSVVNGSTYYIQLDGYAGCGCTFNLCLNSVNSADCSSLLPIELYSFKPEFVNDNLVRLDWITETESNSDFFEVEKTIDGSVFTSVGRIKSSGNSTSDKNYYLFDSEPFLEGVSYYRLKQFDLNGVSQTYQLVSVVGPKSEHFHIYPNPAFTEINIELPKHTGEISLEVYNPMGIKVYEFRDNNHSDFYTIDVKSLETGIYILKVVSNGRVLTQHFIKK